MPERVRDLRANYLHPGVTPDDFPAWNKITLRNVSGTRRISGPGVLGGVLVRRGAADCLVLIYDLADATSPLTDERIAGFASVEGAAGRMAGFVNMPINMEEGILVNIDQADAIVTIYYA